MEIATFKKDGIVIRHEMSASTHTFTVNDRIDVDCFRTTLRRDGRTTSECLFLKDTVNNLSLEEFHVFKHYFDSVKDLLMLWLKRPRSEDSLETCELTEADFHKLLSWDAVSDREKEQLATYRDLMFNRQEALGSNWGETSCVYLMRDEHTGYIKIGKSNKPEYREKTLLSQKPSISLLCYWVDCGPYEEGKLHTMFRDKRGRGEWFLLDESDLEALDAHFVRLGKEKVTVEREALKLVA